MKECNLHVQVEHEAFREFCQAMDPKFQVPGRTAIQTALKSACEELKKKVKENIQHARRLTLCLDI